MKWLFVSGMFVLMVVGLWLAPERTRAEPAPAHETPRGPAAVGTSGTHQGAAEDENADAIRDIETITGANDGMTLVGRRVDLHVEVQDLANERAFWVGSPDNRVLVVLRLDSPTHRTVPVHDGQVAIISGVVRRMPKPEEVTGWRLTKRDGEELADRKIYIRADTVGSVGHRHR